MRYISQYLFSQRHWNCFSQFVQATINAVPPSFLDDFVGDWSSL